MPLAPIPLVTQSYDLNSRPASATRLVNLFAETLPEGSRAPFFLKSSPGTRVWRTFGVGPVYAMATIPGYLYVVSGSRFYRIPIDGSQAVDLGDIGLTAGPSIAVGAAEVVVCSPPNAYIASHNGPLVQITTGTGNFPTEGASSVTTIDGYFIFTNYTGGYFFTSKLLSGSVFNGLDYARSERRPDYVQHGIAHNGELWLWGQDASSVWYNAGAADFPFRPRAAGSVMEQGLGSAQTLAQLDGSIYWLGNDRIIYRTQGYHAVRVSTHPIEEILTAYGDLRDITACAFQFAGHSFYSISIPSTPDGGRTFLYDVATKQWHERSSAGYGRWRIITAAQHGPYLLLGDAYSGNLYEVDSNDTNDAGAPMQRLAVLPNIVSHGPRAFMSRLEVEMEVGTEHSPGTVALDYSDDGGITWSPRRITDTGAAGQTRRRVAYTRLGSFRQRVLRLSATGFLNVYGVDADIEKGST